MQLVRFVCRACGTEAKGAPDKPVRKGECPKCKGDMHRDPDSAIEVINGPDIRSEPKDEAKEPEPPVRYPAAVQPKGGLGAIVERILTLAEAEIEWKT